MKLGVASGRPQHMHTTCLAASAAAQRRLSAVRWLCSQLRAGPPPPRAAADDDAAPYPPFDQQQQQQQAPTSWPQLGPSPYQEQAAAPPQQQALQQQYTPNAGYAAAPALPAQQPYGPPQPAGMPPVYSQGPAAAAYSTAGGSDYTDPSNPAPPDPYSPPLMEDPQQQQPQGYAPAASAYPPLPVVPYAPGARNMAAVSGVLALPPRMTVNNSRSVKVELIIMPFALPQDKQKQCPIKVQAWGDLGLAVYSQLKDMDTVAVVGELRVDYRKMMRTKYGPPITVDAVSVSRVDPATIEPTAFVQMYDGIYERAPEGRGAGREGGSQDGSPRRAYKATGQQLVEDLAAWRSGVSLQDIASSRSIKRGTALQHVLEGWEREGSGAQSLDWQRLLGELQVEGQMVEAIKQGLQQHSGQRDKQGNILCKPVREFLMGHPAVGPSLQAQEASSGAGLDLTYAQIRVVREAVAAGGL